MNKIIKIVLILCTTLGVLLWILYLWVSVMNLAEVFLFNSAFFQERDLVDLPVSFGFVALNIVLIVFLIIRHYKKYKHLNLFETLSNLMDRILN